MKIKLYMALMLFALNSVLFAQQNKLVWYTNLTEASEVSIKTHKPVFAFFTGSDWCGWCIKLHANVFSKDAFIAWAEKNVVLLELDFPRRKQLPPDLAKQNNDLQQTFQVQGFPTVWIFNPEKDIKANTLKIAALGSLGYPAGAEAGKEEVKFIATANGIMGLK
jgi:thiol-disulfide isomerase/thioredoxin